MSIAVGLSGLIPGTHELIAELTERLSTGEAFDNPKLTLAADRIFGGSRAKGTYSPRDAYDAMETAVRATAQMNRRNSSNSPRRLRLPSSSQNYWEPNLPTLCLSLQPVREALRYGLARLEHASSATRLMPAAEHC
jgi:hypothetical protein